MYYLLKLEAISLAGQKVTNKQVTDFELDNNIRFVTRLLHDSSIDVNETGYFWNGSLFERIGDKFKVGDVLPDDVYEIIFEPFPFTSDDLYIYDEINMSFSDLFIPTIRDAWTNMNEPIVFLMQFYGYSTWTDCGEEWDIAHYPIKMLGTDDLEKLL